MASARSPGGSRSSPPAAPAPRPEDAASRRQLRPFPGEGPPQRGDLGGEVSLGGRPHRSASAWCLQPASVIAEPPPHRFRRSADGGRRLSSASMAVKARAGRVAGLDPPWEGMVYLIARGHPVEAHAALRCARPGRRADGPVRWLGDAGAVPRHHRGAPHGAVGRGLLRRQPHGRVPGRGARRARRPAEAHHQRRGGARDRADPVLAAVLSARRRRRRSHRLPARSRSLHADRERLQHPEGLGVGHRARSGCHLEQHVGRHRADRGAGTEGRGARRASGQRRRAGDRLLPLRPGHGGRRRLR